MKLKQASKQSIREFVDGLHRTYRVVDQLFTLDDGFCLSISSDNEVVVIPKGSGYVLLFEHGDGLNSGTRQAVLNKSDAAKMREVHEWLKAKPNYGLRDFFDKASEKLQSRI